MFEFHDIEQNSDEWFEMRGGRLTSSKLGVIMANYSKAFGDPAKRYAQNIAIEIITGNAISSSFTNSAMERGHIEEPIARREYEDHYFCSVTNGGFFSSEFIGCSPDGLVDDDGVIEIKSAEAHIHYERVRKATFDSAYKWQLIGNLKFTNRSWIDFISYCSAYPEGKRLYTFRLFAENLKKEYEMIDLRVEEFKLLVQDSINAISESNYFYK